MTEARYDVAHYRRMFGESTLRHIYAFVATVATRPLNADQFIREKMNVMSATDLPMSTVRKVIFVCHREGVFDTILQEGVHMEAQDSVRRNKKDIGISL